MDSIEDSYDIKDSLSYLEKFIIIALQNELKAQGHSATGSLINSFEGKVITVLNGFVLEILGNDYAFAVNDGRKKNEKKIPLDVLMEWIEQKGIESGEEDIKNAAFAIQNAIYVNGIPSESSLKYSNNGKRTGFIDIVIDEEISKILKQIEDTAFKEYNLEVEKVIKDFNKKNEN